MIIVVEVKFAKWRHAVVLLLICPMYINYSKAIVNGTRKGDGSPSQSVIWKGSDLEHMHCSNTIGAADGALVVGCLETMLFDSMCPLKGQEGTVDRGARRNIASLIINNCASWHQVARNVFELVSREC